MNNPTILSVGSQYPFPIVQTGGVIDIFGGEQSTLLVAFEGITESEKEALDSGNIKCGLLADGGSIMLVWEFSDANQKPIFFVETPLDVRRCETPFIPLIDTKQTRLAIAIQVVDTLTNTIVSLRYISFSPELSADLVDAFNVQLQTKIEDYDQLHNWFSIPTPHLLRKAKLHELGKE